MSNVLEQASPASELDLIDYPCPCCGGSSTTTLLESTVNHDRQVDARDFNCTNAGHGEHYRVVRCNGCTMAYCSPRPTVEALLQAYAGGEDDTYIEGEGGRERTFARALRSFSRNVGRLLDIGCNTGVFLEQAQKVGFQCYGVEPSAYAADRARRTKGFDVHTGAVPGDLPWSEPFDVITMWDVIEHLDDPLETLTFLRAQLQNGGELHLSTMDFGSPYARIAGKSWPWLMRMHIHYFTKRSMKEMLHRAGFQHVKIIQYRHIVHSSYLYAKLENLALPLRVIGHLGGRILQDKDGYVTVNMGDMMHAIAS